MAQSDSKEAQALLIDPFNAPEPSEETGLGSHFGSTFANMPNSSSGAATGVQSAASMSGKDPFDPATFKKVSGMSSTSPTVHGKVEMVGQMDKGGSSTSSRAMDGGSGGIRGTSSKNHVHVHGSEALVEHERRSRRSGSQPRSSAAQQYHPEIAGSDGHRSGHRRNSSLKDRFPGDTSTQPLENIRQDSRKANRSPHLNKRHMPGADIVDRLDPAIGGRAYHHEGPFDAALLARNTDPKTAPINALETSNAEALKATPQEKVRDAVERHKPLDGVAVVPPGMPDKFGRTYNYEEGADMMHERGEDEGYKRWAGETYDDGDLKGQSEPGYSLDRAMQAHKIDENGIEMENRAGVMKDYRNAERSGTLDKRDPVTIAGDESKYVDAYYANSTENDAAKMGGMGPSGSLKEGIKKRIGSLRHRKHGSRDEA